MTVAPHTDATRYRARVEDRSGERWSVIGPLTFLDSHAAEQRLTILWIKPS